MQRDEKPSVYKQAKPPQPKEALLVSVTHPLHTCGLENFNGWLTSNPRMASLIPGIKTLKAESPDTVVDPKEFGDDWSETLEKKDAERLRNYFQSVEYLGKVIDFINVRVGGEDNVIELRGSKFQKGIVFEVPRRSLMRAVRFEAFDDLLIGNFMKTTLAGKWPQSMLYPDFTPYVTKYADNGLAKTPEQLKFYFREYRHRAPLDYLRHRMQLTVANAVRTHMDSRSKPYQLAQKTWWFANKRISP